MKTVLAFIVLFTACDLDYVPWVEQTKTTSNLKPKKEKPKIIQKLRAVNPFKFYNQLDRIENNGNESESESESESWSEPGSESESEAESESEVPTEICTETDLTGPADGAPVFRLYDTGLSGRISPGIRKVLGILASAKNNPGCVAVQTTEISLLVWFPDDIEYENRPYNAEIRDTETNDLLARDHTYEDWEEYREFIFTDPVIFTPEETRRLSFWINLDGAIDPNFSWVLAELTPTVSWQLYESENNNEYLNYIDLAGEMFWF